MFALWLKIISLKTIKKVESAKRTNKDNWGIKTLKYHAISGKLIIKWQFPGKKLWKLATKCNIMDWRWDKTVGHNNMTYPHPQILNRLKNEREKK